MDQYTKPVRGYGTTPLRGNPTDSYAVDAIRRGMHRKASYSYLAGRRAARQA